MDAIRPGALVRFKLTVLRYERDIYLQTTDRQHEIKAGTIGMVVAMVEGTWQEGGMRPVIFTSTGRRLCEKSGNLEVMACLPR
jgi:hypothetical protein